MAYVATSSAATSLQINLTVASSAFHGLKVDADGLLTYSRVFLTENATVNLSDGSGIPISGLSGLVAGTNNDAAKGTVSGQLYQQVRVDDIKLTYYLNADGYLVAKYFGDYSYAGQQDGATRNWKSNG